MMPWWLQSLWGFIASSASIATLIGCAALAVAILEPKFLDAITDLRKWAICVAVIAFGYTSVAGKFYHDGLVEKQRQWDSALVVETENGERARSDAVDAVRNATPSSVSNDPRNRDNWGKQPESGKGGPVRWLESHRFFGK